MSKILNLYSVNAPSQDYLLNHCDFLIKIKNLQMKIHTLGYQDLSNSSSFIVSTSTANARIRLPQDIDQFTLIAHPRILNMWTQPCKITVNLIDENYKAGDVIRFNFHTELGEFITQLTFEQEKFLPNMEESVSSTVSEVQEYQLINNHGNQQINNPKQSNCYEDPYEAKTNSKDKNQKVNFVKTVKMTRNNVHVCSDGFLFTHTKEVKL